MERPSVTEQAFLNSIKDKPNDDSLRLIFADWLEENGRPERAELIRMQVEDACLPFWYPKKALLQQRQDELLREHGTAWLGRWVGLGHFERGLICLEGTVEQLKERLAEAKSEADLVWVEGLRLRSEWPQPIQPLLDSPLLRHLTSLDLTHRGIGDPGAAALAASPQLSRLTSLILDSNDIGPDTRTR